VKKYILLILAVFTAAILTACTTVGIDELYQLPRQAADDLELQAMLDQIIGSGAQYAAPAAGQNRQSVQRHDIDGDGTDEVLAFFRQKGQERLQIYIFREIGGTYEVASVIEGDGTSIGSITYADMNGDGASALVVGWRTGAELQMLGVYEMTDLQPKTVLLTDYTSYTVGDLNRDGCTDLLVLSHDTALETGTVNCYRFQGGQEPTRTTAALSPGMTAVNHVRLGTLTGGEPALFVTGDYEEGRVITDIFAMPDDVLKNISAGADGISTETLMTYPTTSSAAIDLVDINGDGVLEIPAAVQLGDGLESGFYLLYWYRFDITGNREHVLTTYHNYTDGWYFEIPDTWQEILTLHRVDSAGERALIFTLRTGEEPQEVMAVYTLTGDNKLNKAGEGNRFTLYIDGNNIYAAEILADIDVGLTQEQIQSAFHIIVPAWDA